MNDRRRLVLLLINMTTVVLIVAGLGIYLLYRTAVGQQKTRLSETARTQALFLESLYHATEKPEMIEEIVAQASRQFQGVSRTGAVQIGKLQGDRIVLLENRSKEPGQTGVPWSGNLDQPMRRALQGYSGTIVGPDHRGVQVLAAYEPVRHLDWGVVAQVDLAEIRAAYIQAGLYTFLLAVLVNGLGGLLLWRLSNPMVRELRERKILTQDLENRVAERMSELSELNEQFRHEITERQRLEEVLHREIDLLARIMETSPVGILMIEPTGKIVIASEQAETMLGLVKTGQGYQMPHWRLTDASGNPIIDRNQFWRQVIETRQSVYDVRQTLEFDDGRKLLLSVNGSPVLDETGKLEGVVFTVEDITNRVRIEAALLQSETQFRAIFEQASVGIGIVTLSGQFIRVNQRYCELTGYSEAELQEKSYQDILHPDDLDPGDATTDMEIFSLEKRYIRKDGSIIWVHLSGSVVNSPNAEPMYILGVVEDISQRKQTEEALQRANTQLTAWVRELEQRNQDILLLNQVSDFLQACLTIEEAYRVIAELLPALFIGYQGALFTINNSSNLVEAVATWGENLYSKTLFTYDECWALRRGKIHWVNTEHSSLLCRHVHSDGEFQESLCVPMMAQGKAMGLLYLHAAAATRLSEAKRQLAQTVAEHLSLALANLKLRETLQAQSIVDPLTNLYNRRYMEESLKREINLATRKRHPVGIMMLDVDHFRQINETFGHEGGNCALQAVGNFLSGQIRSGDIACRYGGEEFLLILPEASLEISVQRAEQIRQGIKQLQINYGEQLLTQITVSIGLSCFPDHGKTIEALIQAADLALYQAKHEGRDRAIRYSIT